MPKMALTSKHAACFDGPIPRATERLHNLTMRVNNSSQAKPAPR